MTISGGDEVGVTINADYIILRGLIIADVGQHGIELMGVNHVIIEGCDISVWGTLSDGGYQTEDDCGIWSNQCGLNTITIQNCAIHHPRYDTNNWSEYNSSVPDCSPGDCHPAGANAISFECQNDEDIPSTGNYVIRNNKIYSDYDHIFNDAIGADNNFSYNGFPIRDSDIYGNEVSHVWDDALEIEGGNMNVRVWGNILDSINIAFGIAPVSIGPLYVFRNISKWGKAKPDRDFGWSMFKIGINNDEWNQGALFLYHFVEYNDVHPGFVVFDIEIENNLVLNNFDIREEADQYTALIKPIPGIVVFDEKLNIDLIPLSGSAGSKIMAIELFDVTTSVATQPNLTNKLIIYPNPTDNLFTVIGTKEELSHMKIYNLLGQDVTGLSSIISRTDGQVIFDISRLKKGAYYFVTADSANLIIKD